MIVVGGGLAGAAAACALAAGGARPLVLERDAGSADKVCGEFLSWETVRLLRALGVDPVDLGAEPITEVRLAHGGVLARARLPFPALGLSRRRLDAALLDAAAAAGARVERGARLASVDDAGRGAAVFVATGKHTLRGVERPRGGGLTALKMYYALAPAQAAALAGAVELVLFPGGYAGLQAVEGGRANLCLLTRDPAGGLEAAVAAAPHLARRLAGAEPLLDRPLAAANLPYGMVHRPGPADAPGRFRLGDQWGMIPSFTGDGMALALATAAMAARAWRDHGAAGAAAYHARAARRLGPRVRRAAWLAEAGLRPEAARLFALAGRAAPCLLAAAARATRVPERTVAELA